MKYKTTAFSVLMLLLSGKIGAADGPGLGNLQYDSAEVFGPVSIITSPKGHGNAAIINGYLMVIYSADGGGRSGDGGIEFWDVSDPRQPRLHRRWDNPDTHGLREAHGFGFTQQNGRDLMVAQAIEGIQFWDVTDPDAAFLVSYLDLPGITRADYGGAWWTFWQAPIVYVAGVDEGLYVVDASNPAAPEILRHMPTSDIAGLNPGIVQAIGNLLFVGRHQGTGYATLDISDPRNPRLLSAITGNSGYSHMLAAGKILTSGGNGGTRTMHVHNVTAGGAITYASSGPIRCGAPSNQRLGNGGFSRERALDRTQTT
jgi:hypothetical protein